MNDKTRKLTLTAMLGAMAYLLMLVGRIPVVLFLSYDPKDAIIAIGGFLLGPLPAAAISLVVSFVEMLSASATGPIGFVMNVLSTCAFVLPAALLYHKKHSLGRAAAGLAMGVVCMTALMLAWNFLITPLYMGVPRQAVADMLLPVFLPFNLLKGLINAAAALLIYKPISRTLRRAKLIPSTGHGPGVDRKSQILLIAVSVIVIITAAACFYLLGHS